jgi:DNA-binding NarL/FixJ family response regulator
VIPTNDSPSPPGRILVIDDLPDALAWLTAACRQAFPAAEVTGVQTLLDAMQVLDGDSPDLALVDLGLPDGSGNEFISAAAHTRPDTICVVTTVFGDDQHLFAALRAGAKGYLLKDRDQESLAGLLRGIVEGRPPLSPAIARRLLDHFHATPSESDAGLTSREQDVLTLLAKGLTVAEAAKLLDITANTAAGYVKNVYRKLNVTSRAEATVEAARRGLIDVQRSE